MKIIELGPSYRNKFGFDEVIYDRWLYQQVETYFSFSRKFHSGLQGESRNLSIELHNKLNQ